MVPGESSDTDQRQVDESLQLEIRRLEIDEKRLALDEKKALFDQRFWHRNFGTMTTFSVAFLGLVLSVAQVWVAYIQKQNENQQRSHEIELTDFQKERELEAQEKRDLRDFVSKKESEIFSSDSGTRENVRKLLLSAFSPQIVQPVINNLFAISPPAQRDTWAQARTEVAGLVMDQAKPIVYVHYQDKADAGVVDEVVSSLVAAGFRAPGKELVVQQTKGDVRYFHADEKEQAASIAAIVHDRLQQHGWDKTLSPLFAGQTFPNVPRNQFEVWIPGRGAQ